MTESRTTPTEPIHDLDHAVGGRPIGGPDSDLGLDGLAAMTTEELTHLYLAGRIPERDLEALAGSPPCRMLAVQGYFGRGTVAEVLRRFAASSRFPWRGKSFSPHGAEAGSGVNRVQIGPLVRDVFAFTTQVGYSAIDGLPCIVLDYEQPGNPWPIRQVHDELREVAPGLFLGPAMWKTRSQPRLLFYFAVDVG